VSVAGSQRRRRVALFSDAKTVSASIVVAALSTALPSGGFVVDGHSHYWLIVPTHASRRSQCRCAVIHPQFRTALLCYKAENRLVVAGAERPALVLLN
jgi:hypothetical protein